ncbi:FecCD family ABC transporter permease [Corynebacterium pacaense]|uniref:FecCD family ABC transporter permease n=1 Tax=Corynebacterium pacaense TaxID=1816684 RepID=UPI003CCBB448
MFGVRSISVTDAFQSLLGATSTTEQAAAAKRLPRTVLGIVIGAALAVSGMTMQAVTRNPLADPGIFGVLTGASLAVVIGIAFFGLGNPVATMIVAVIGSAAAAVFVYTVGSLGRGGATPLKLALAGAATSAALSALVSAVLLPRVQVMDSFRFWQIGGIGGAEWDRMTMAAPFLILGFLICWLSAAGMNALALGDEVATGLGVNVLRTRLVSSAGAVLLCGVATALAGPIAFVGLIIPHLCRLIVGTDHRWLVPASALSGAVLILLADTLGRVITRPSEVAVGIIMPLIGAPLFIWIVRRQKVRDL